VKIPGLARGSSDIGLPVGAALGGDEMRDDRGRGEERLHAALLHDVRLRHALVMAHVLEPRFGEERLQHPSGLRGVLEYAPCVRSIAATLRREVIERREERVAIRRRDAILDRDQHRSDRLARALGIDLTDESVLPVVTICSQSESDAVAAVLKVGREYESRAPGHRMSALQDLEAGRPLEVHETLGYALRKAAQNRIPMPLVDAFYQTIAAVDRIRHAGTNG